MTRNGRPALLVVEDEKLVRWSVREALKGLARVRLAATAEKALRTLEGPARLDGLLVDVRLPGMDGLELARQARRIRPGLKVFVMTAYDHDRAARDAFGVRAEAYLPKPFSLEVLRDMLASHLP
ncbi:MAG TPA: response regulator [Planctomycetota bacterium]